MCLLRTFLSSALIISTASSSSARQESSHSATGNLTIEKINMTDTEADVKYDLTQQHFVNDLSPTVSERPAEDVLPAGTTHAVVRPPIDYSSPGALVRSTWRRFASLWTRRFTLALLAGQVVSLCITCTNVTTTELVMRNWSLSTTQTWFL